MKTLLSKIGSREKSALHGLIYIVLLLLISILLEGCTDRCETRNSYVYYEPVYTSLDELRSMVEQGDPRELNQLGKLYLKNDYLFINEPGEGIHVIDNHDPSNPIKESFIEIPGNFSLSAKGNYLYADSYVDLVVLDISNPNNVTEVNRLLNIFKDYNSYGFYVDPELGIVTDWVEVEQVDLYESECDDIYPVYNRWGAVKYESGIALDYAAASPPTGPTVGVGGSLATFTIYDNYLYSIDDSDLTIINISNLSSPLVHSKQTVGWGIETLFPYEDKLFIGANNGMYIYSNEEPSNPELITMYSHMTSCDPVVVQDNYAYVTLRSGNTCAGFSNQLEVIDLSDINNPQLEVTYPMYNPYGLGIDGEALFICDGEAGLKIYDASDIYTIDEHLKIQYPNITALDVIPYNNVLMMISEQGLFQYDYSDLENIVLISEIRTTDNQ